MRAFEILAEMIVRYRESHSDTVIAFRDSIWLVDENGATPRNVLADIKRRTGLRGKSLELMLMDARDERPDILVGYIDDRRLRLDNTVSIALNPHTSLLVKKVVAQLGLDGVDWSHMDHEGDEYDVNVAPHQMAGRLPDVVYHGTSTRHLPNIMKIGLAPNDNSNWPLGKFHDKIFLTANFQDAAFHANHTVDNEHATPIVIATHIPDPSKITVDYDVAQHLYGANPATDREGYTASFITNLNAQEFRRRSVIQRRNQGRDFTREIGILGYRGRIPASQFTAIWISNDGGSIDTRNAVEVTPDKFWDILDL